MINKFNELMSWFSNIKTQDNKRVNVIKQVITNKKINEIENQNEFINPWHNKLCPWCTLDKWFCFSQLLWGFTCKVIQWLLIWFSQWGV